MIRLLAHSVMGGADQRSAARSAPLRPRRRYCCESVLFRNGQNLYTILRLANCARCKIELATTERTEGTEEKVESALLREG